MMDEMIFTVTLTDSPVIRDESGCELTPDDLTPAGLIDLASRLEALAAACREFASQSA